MQRLADLARTRANQHDVSRRRSAARLPLHARHCVLHQSKNTVQVNCYGAATLLRGHVFDGNTLNYPDAMIGQQGIHSSQSLARRIQLTAEQRAVNPGRIEPTSKRTELLCQFLRRVLRALVTEHDLCPAAANILTVAAPIPREPPLIIAVLTASDRSTLM